MKKLILVVISCLSVAISSAQKKTSVKHLNGTVVSVALLQQQIAHIVDSAQIAGLQVAIINNNQTVWTGSFGLKNVEKHLALNDSTAMYGASFTKTIMAYLVLRLCDKAIHQYLKKKIPDYPKWQDLADDTTSFNKITMRMILSHTSGMPILRSMYGDKLNLIAKPGQKFYYSNEAMNFLGFVIEEYTGRLLDDLASEIIFKPLNMQHTCMIWNPAYEQNYSIAYFKDGKVYGSERKPQSRGAGSVTTTASDYAKFVIALQTGFGLSKSSYSQMFNLQIAITSRKGFGPERDSLTTDNKKAGLAWGLGTGLINTPYGKAYFHTGHGEANQNFYIAYPKQKIAVVLLSNSENFEPAAHLILKATIGDVYAPLNWLGY